MGYAAFSEILELTSQLERERLTKIITNCIKFSIIIDGSVDSKQQDNKYVMVRYASQKDILTLKTVILSIHVPDNDGAEGLLEAVLQTFETVNLPDNVVKSKMAGITTDSESANIGQKGGLWAKLQNHYNRIFLTFLVFLS